MSRQAAANLGVRAHWHDWEQTLAHRGIGDFGKYAMFYGDGREQVRMREQQLCLAQKEIARVSNREMKPIEDAGLCLRVEVHEGIAAHQQIQARNRSVLDEI